MDCVMAGIEWRITFPQSLGIVGEKVRGLILDRLLGVKCTAKQLKSKFKRKTILTVLINFRCKVVEWTAR